MLNVLIIGIFVFVFVYFWHKLFNWINNRTSYKINKVLRRFITNLIIGLGIALFLIYFNHYPWLMDIEDASMDFAMQVRQATIPPAHKKQIPPFVFLDIDNKTHQLWGEPLFTPRNKIKALIELAVRSDARLIVVDIDLSQQTPFFESKLHPYDQELYDYIANYKKYCQTCPPIIFARAFRPLPESTITKEAEPIRELRIGFLEKAVAQSAPNVQWGSPLFIRSSYDNVIRRWWLWQPVCADKQPQVLPSIELLAAAMIRHKTPEQAQESLNNALADFKPKNCTDSYLPESKPSKPIIIAKDFVISEGMRGIRQRIMYNMPWLPPQKQTSTVRYYLQDYDKETENRETILTVFSAQTSVSAAALKDNIVVIGGSYSDGRDMHSTPLGSMPGALIVINAIHSLLQHGEIKPSPIWLKLLLTAIAIILVSILFMYFSSFWSVIFTGTTIILLLIPLSIWQLGHGVWIDFALPLLGVQFHQIAADFHEMAEKLEK